MLTCAIGILRIDQGRGGVQILPPPGVSLSDGGTIPPPKKLKDVKPVLPDLAAVAHISGDVIVEFVIDASGKVTHSRLLRSIPLFDEAALDAVEQWKFEPTLLNGVAVPVLTTAVVSFGK
jgi:protein TonB